MKCLTSELRVPAEAEIVIEGRFLPGVREPEGPFGEFPQYYGERAERHVMEIDAVTHRKDAIFHTIVGGGLEHLLLGAIPREATLLAHLQRTFPNVRDVHLAPRRRVPLPPLRPDPQAPGGRGQERHARRLRRAITT